MSNWFWRRDLIIVICGGLCFAFSALASAPQEASKKKLILKHDPTRPAVTEVAVETDKKELKEEAYVLSSIIVSPTRRIALINAKFVKVGDTIGEASVLKINRHSVILGVPGKKITIYLIDKKGWE